MADSHPSQGHRERLRQRFIVNKVSFTETDLLELLLTYAVPLRDVAGTAQKLIQRFGNLEAVLNATTEDLMTVDGVGERTVILFKLAQEILNKVNNGPAAVQVPLFDTMLVNLDADSVERPNEATEGPELASGDESEIEEQDLRAFVNDEVEHSQQYLPESFHYKILDDFYAFLCQHLPYNSETTRRRRSNYIIRRFFPRGTIETPLPRFLHESESEAGRNIAIFYHILRAEPLVAKVAEDLMWPSLARGHITREELRSFILQHLPNLSVSSQKNAIRSLITVYDKLGIATAEGDGLRFQLHPGDLDGFYPGH